MSEQFNQEQTRLVYVTLFLGLHFFLSISFFYNAAPKVEKETGEALAAPESDGLPTS